MSGQSKGVEHSLSQRTIDDQRRKRSEGGATPIWYDKAVNEKCQEEVMPIPKDKVGLVIGKKGWRIKDVMERSGVKELSIKQEQVHIRGTEEQRTNAKKIIDMIVRGEDNPDQGSWKKLDFIPEEYMGRIIGKDHNQLNEIEHKTGASLKVFHNNSNTLLCIKGSVESQKRAIREIKEIVNIMMKRSLQSGERPVRLVHVDTTQLSLNHEFQLSTIQLPNACNSGETSYKLKQLDHPSQDTEDGFTDINKLKDELVRTLEKIHKEKEEEMIKVVVWCHLGHVYITRVSEADQKEDYFTLAEIKGKLEDPKSWKCGIFKGGLEDIEIEQIEKDLESRAVKEDLRYDFTFYTPSCRDVRVKAWLTEKDAEQEGDETTSMEFSRSAPVRVKNILTRTLPDDQQDSSNSPCFYMCSQYQYRMKVDILMLSKKFDYRLLIRTCQSYVPKTPQDEEEDKLLKNYLMGMKIEGDQLKLPPATELPDGFDLFYQRRSLRRTYQYDEFSLTICKEQEKTVDPVETDASDVHETATKTDIHLHCEEWDQMLREGNSWEPEQIVAKLPSFLEFLRQVQSNVAT